MQKCYFAIFIVAIKSSNKEQAHGVGSVTWKASHGDHLSLPPHPPHQLPVLKGL